MAGIKLFLNGGKQLFILEIYRPPRGSLEESLIIISRVLETFPTNNNPICIVGDLNVDSLNKKKENENNALRDLLATYIIHRVNLPPTRITNVSRSSIDVVCSNLSPAMLKVKVVHEHIADHAGQLCALSIPAKAKIQPTATYIQLNNQNLSRLRNLLAEEDWNNIFQTMDVEKAYSALMVTTTSALDATCPYKTSRSKKTGVKLFLYTPEVLRLRTEFIEAQERSNSTGRADDRLEAAQKKKTYDLKLKTIRREASEELISRSSNKSKAVWSVVNAERRACEDVNNTTWQLRISNDIVTDPVEVANSFNEYFTTIAGDILRAGNVQKSTQVAGCNHHLVNELTAFSLETTDEVRGIIRALKQKTSTGVDDVLFQTSESTVKRKLCLPLTSVVNKSLEQATFPSLMKVAKVYPLHKKGKRDGISNFRPISLVPTFSKRLEKVVLTRIVRHLNSNNIIPEAQHGFMPGRSTITAVASIVEHILDNLEAGRTVGGAFLDLSKAFDCLDHGLILAKLGAVGVVGAAQEWFRTYLFGRRQLVEIRQNHQR
ncbi:uncharacterized protein LOC124371967 [Homalodisca vitripennis]|uniref:uncharacterized protein LOC124371967 n=1 Tax=Homalodisca vitripennis TaxID=197043 RepID=UPI001EEC7C1C|nr:uncharacterized protein LOC124371967 [Homalodisca vitripennis]